MNVDLDTWLAVRMAPMFLAETTRASGRTSTPWSHRWYVCDPLPATAKYQDESGKVIVEIRSTGTATVWPGRNTPPASRMSGTRKKSRPRSTGPRSQRRSGRLAAAVLLVQHYPSPGGREQLKLPLVGALLRLGWSDEEVRNFVFTVATAANDDEAPDRVSGIERTRQRLLNGEPVTGWKQTRRRPPTPRQRSSASGRGSDPVPLDRAPERRQRVDDFFAYLPEHKYIFVPTRSIWVEKSVKASVAPVVIGIDDDGEEIRQPATAWLDTHKPVHQMTWAPGLPEIIEGRVLDQGGWNERPDLRASTTTGHLPSRWEIPTRQPGGSSTPTTLPGGDRPHHRLAGAPSAVSARKDQPRAGARWRVKGWQGTILGLRSTPGGWRLERRQCLTPRTKCTGRFNGYVKKRAPAESTRHATSARSTGTASTSAWKA